MSIYNSLNENQKRTLLALLIHASKIDKTNHFNEMTFIESISKQLNISDKTLLNIRNKTDSFIFDLPTQEDDRMIMYMHFIHLIRIDGEISSSEVKLASQIGLLLGMNPLLIKDLLDNYQNEINTGYKLRDKELSLLIKKYLN